MDKRQFQKAWSNDSPLNDNTVSQSADQSNKSKSPSQNEAIGYRAARNRALGSQAINFVVSRIIHTGNNSTFSNIFQGSC